MREPVLAHAGAFVALALRDLIVRRGGRREHLDDPVRGAAHTALVDPCGVADHEHVGLDHRVDGCVGLVTAGQADVERCDQYAAGRVAEVGVPESPSGLLVDPGDSEESPEAGAASIAESSAGPRPGGTAATGAEATGAGPTGTGATAPGAVEVADATAPVSGTQLAESGADPASADPRAAAPGQPPDEAAGEPAATSASAAGAGAPTPAPAGAGDGALSAPEDDERIGAETAQAPDDGVLLTGRVLFRLNSTTVDPPFEPVLDEIAAALASAEDAYAEVFGFTDRFGSLEYNMALSRQRAQSVANRLIALGIPAERLRVEGQGPRPPDPDEELTRDEERMVEVTVKRQGGAE